MEASILTTPRRDISFPGLPTDTAVENLPEAFAPLIRNAWYVVAETKDVGRELRHIFALGEPLVMYRTEAGEAVVLDDRCAHRRFPLSKSKLVGDTIQCGYHGFTYEKSGACIWAPTLNVQPRFGVRRYPAAEVGPWIWAWMGDPEKADVANIPYPQLDPSVKWRLAECYKHNAGNYSLLIENLLDLTHLHFLHGPDVSTLEEANNAPRAVQLEESNAVGWTKETVDVASGLFAGLAGGNPAQLVRVCTTESQFGPSLNYGTEVRFARAGEESDLYPLRFHVIHALTPQDLHNTHQFTQFAFSAELVNGIEGFRDFARDVVFQQDCDAIVAMQRAIVNDQRTGNVESGIPGDRFGIKMRQVLRGLKKQET